MSKWTLGELKVGPPQRSAPVCAPLQSYILGLLTALGGQLLVEFWELRLHRDADGAAQKMGPPRHGTPLLQERKGNEETEHGRRMGAYRRGEMVAALNAEVTYSPYL